MTDLVTMTVVVSCRPKRALGHINNNYALVQRSPPIFDIPFAAHVLHLFFFYRKPNSNRQKADLSPMRNVVSIDTINQKSQTYSHISLHKLQLWKPSNFEMNYISFYVMTKFEVFHNNLVDCNYRILGNISRPLLYDDLE